MPRKSRSYKKKGVKKSRYSLKINTTALVLVVALLLIVFNIYSRPNKPAIEAKKITEAILDDNPISFATDGLVDENKLKKVKNMDYNEFKNHLNAKNDFCVYIEDEKGNILLSKGSSKLNSDGVFCKE